MGKPFRLGNMNTTRFLSEQEKEKGLKAHMAHQRYNGAGFNFIGDTPITLLAIYFGASNVQLGYLSSVLYITGVLLLLVPRLFKGWNLSRLHFWAWILRGASCLLYTALWFVTGKNAVLLILIGYTLFCSTRIVGVALYQPILRMISSRQNRGEVVARSSINFQLSLTFARLISFGVTSLQRLSGTAGLLILQYVGIILNTAAAFKARAIPCRETVSYQKGENLWRIFRKAMADRGMRRVIFLNWINIALIILFGFLVPFLRRGAGIKTNQIFLFTLAMGISNILAGYFTKTFADRLGSKPLLWGSFLALSGCALSWSVIPAASPFPVFAALGFVTGFFLNSGNMLISRIIVRVLPEGDTVGYNSMINFAAALISIMIGAGGGFLADLQSSGFISLPNSYSLTFAAALAAALTAFVTSTGIREPESLSGKEAMEILFSPSKLQTFWQIGKLNKTKDPFTRQTILHNLGKTENPLTTEEIHSIMANPLSVDKGELIKSLFTYPRPELLKDLLREAENPGSYHRLKAIFALGAYPGKKTEKLLSLLLNDPDPVVRSNSAKSLSRIGAGEYRSVITSQAAEARGVWNNMNYLIAVHNYDKEGHYLRDLFSPRTLSQNSLHRQTLYSLYAKVQDFSPPLDRIYQHRNLHKGEGLRDFLDDARDIPGFLEGHKDFIYWFSRGEFDPIWNRCVTLLEGGAIAPYFQGLAQSIRAAAGPERDYDDTLAGLYMTYQVLKESRHLLRRQR